MKPNDFENQRRNEETTKKNIITPELEKKWTDPNNKIIMEYAFTDGAIAIDEYNDAKRRKPKRADYLLLHSQEVILAIVEAKGLDHSADEGYSQVVKYARELDVPFAYTTNGDDLIEKDMISGLNKKMKLCDFPTEDELWQRFLLETDMSPQTEELYTYPYYRTPTGKVPRYYQRIAINRAVKLISEGKKRLLIVLATGTGKTFCSFQIIHRFWKTRTKRKILYLADRNILIDQTMKKDFAPFEHAMCKINNRNIDTSRDVFLGLYQQLKSADTDYYKQLPRDFFDLIIIDECHRGSARMDSNWHDILDYFASAVQIGMTATPKDGGIEEALNELDEARRLYADAQASNNSIRIKQAEKELYKANKKYEKAYNNSNTAYFGEPIYTYSLKQGIDDGFLAPYRVISVELNIDKYGYRPPKGTLDVDGNPVEDRLYTQDDFDRTIIVEDRRRLVAKRISEFLKVNDARYQKTIVFCEDIEHCQEMVRLLENENADFVAEDPRYIMQITGDNEEGKAQLDNFVDPSSKYPVIAVTSKLMSTGVDAETCKNIILDRKIGSMTEFKQIVGRGTRIKKHYSIDGEEYEKMFFNVIDFRKNYLKFNDPDFDGEPVTVTEVPEGNPFTPPPIKPPLPPKPPKPETPKVIRVNGVDVSVIGEDVQYLDENGNLVKQDIISVTRNYITTQYPNEEDFAKAWLLNNNKMQMASDLLLDIDWSDNFKKRYGYSVDKYDIIRFIAYGIEPPLSKKQRTETAAVARYLDGFSDDKKAIVRLLLETYVRTDFTNLKNMKAIFRQKKFASLGYTPMRIMKMFGNRKKYYDFLKELENKLYE